MTLECFIDNVLKPVFRTKLKCYLVDRLKNPIVSYYHNYTNLLNIDLLTYDPKERTNVPLFFYDSNHGPVKSGDCILYSIVLKIYSVSDPFLEVSNKTSEELMELEKVYLMEDLSIEEHINNFSVFFLKSLGLDKDFEDYLNNAEGEVIF